MFKIVNWPTTQAIGVQPGKEIIAVLEELYPELDFSDLTVMAAECAWYNHVGLVFVRGPIPADFDPDEELGMELDGTTYR